MGDLSPALIRHIALQREIFHTWILDWMEFARPEKSVHSQNRKLKAIPGQGLRGLYQNEIEIHVQVNNNN